MTETELRVPWRDRDTGEHGVFTGTVTSKRDIGHYYSCPWIAAFPAYVRASERIARDAIRKVERVIRFMDHTGLMQSKTYIRALGKWLPRHGGFPSAFDHTLVWREPHGGGARCVTTEPYGQLDELTSWARENGWQMVVAPEFGMWNPPLSRLVVLAPPGGLDIVALMRDGGPLAYAPPEKPAALLPGWLDARGMRLGGLPVLRKRNSRQRWRVEGPGFGKGRQTIYAIEWDLQFWVRRRPRGFFGGLSMWAQHWNGRRIPQMAEIADFGLQVWERYKGAAVRTALASWGNSSLHVSGVPEAVIVELLHELDRRLPALVSEAETERWPTIASA